MQEQQDAVSLELADIVKALPTTSIEFQGSGIEDKGDEVPHEHSPLVTALPSVPITPTEQAVAEMYSSGLSTRSVAESLGIPKASVKNILGKPHIKDFVSALVNAQYTSSIEGRLRIMNKIAEDKLEEIERDYDGDFARATNKDIVDVLHGIDHMLKERQKKELGTSDNVYLSIVQQITGK